MTEALLYQKLDKEKVRCNLCAHHCIVHPGKAGLNYVYIGNVSSDRDMDTKCPQCGYVLIERLGFGITQNDIKDGHCPNCGMKITGIGL
jgi:rubrerythrin